MGTTNQMGSELSDYEVETGPVDYLLVEWTGAQPTGEAIPHLIDLVDRGLVRILDLAFIAKTDDGSLLTLEISEVAAQDERFSVFEGAPSGLIGDEDLALAASVLENGTSAAFLVYENTWAAPFATALRRSGAELVASGRISVEDLLEALDASESDN